LGAVRQAAYASSAFGQFRNAGGMSGFSESLSQHRHHHVNASEVAHFHEVK
jgi:hypothetical protein